MEPTTSFIPKKSLDTTPTRTSSSSVGIVTLLSTLVFLVALAGSVGVFLYQKKLAQDLQQAKETLAARQKLFDPQLIKDFETLDGRLNAAKSLLASHVHMSHIFELLQMNTIKTVRYSRFAYDVNAETNTVRISLGGQAKDYASIALQSDYFGENSIIKSYEFSNLSLDPMGNILFDLNLTVDKDILMYESVPKVVRPEPSGGSVTSSTPLPTLPQTLVVPGAGTPPTKNQ